PASDQVYWDAGCPGFGVKVTPKGRKVFIVLYRTGGAGSKLRKFTIGPDGRVTLHQARVVAQKVFAREAGGARLGRREAERTAASRCRQGGRPLGELHRPALLDGRALIAETFRNQLLRLFKDSSSMRMKAAGARHFPLATNTRRHGFPVT